jgi:hypothetical protein
MPPSPRCRQAGVRWYRAHSPLPPHNDKLCFGGGVAALPTCTASADPLPPCPYKKNARCTEGSGYATSLLVAPPVPPRSPSPGPSPARADAGEGGSESGLRGAGGAPILHGARLPAPSAHTQQNGMCAEGSGYASSLYMAPGPSTRLLLPPRYATRPQGADACGGQSSRASVGGRGSIWPRMVDNSDIARHRRQAAS